jgi:hypothetical protein
MPVFIFSTQDQSSNKEEEEEVEALPNVCHVLNGHSNIK